MGYLRDANCIAKIGQMAFVSQMYDVICFANYFASCSMRRSTLRKRGRRLEQIANCFASYNMQRFTLRKYAFLLTCCIMGTVQEVQEEDHSYRNDNGRGACKEHLFEHVDALLVSGFGWD